MGIFNRRNNKAAAKQPIVSGIEKLWTRAPTREKAEMPDMVHKNPRLDPVLIIAKYIAATDIGIFSKADLRINGDSAKMMPDHELYNLLDTPIKRYPEIDRYTLFYLTAALIEATGEFGWLKLRDDSGHVIELNPIPSAWITNTPTVATPYFIIYPFGVSAGRQYKAAAQDFVYFKRPDLNDPYGRGRGSAESIADEVMTDELLAKLSKNLAYNDGTPKTIVSAEGITPENADAFKQSWMQKIGGGLHHGEPAIIPKDVTITKLTMTPEEMDYIESRRYLRDESLQHYQLPPEIYGVLESSNRSTINSAYYLLQKNVLNDKYRFIERAVTRQLVGPDFDTKLCMKFLDEVPEDEQQKLTTMTSGLSAGVVTVNEWRKSFGLGELPEEKGNVFLRGFSTYEVPVKGKTIKEEKPQKEPGPEQTVIDEENIGKAVVNIVKGESVKVVSEKDESRLLAIWKAFDSRATSHEGEFVDAVDRFGRKQEKLVASALDNVEKVGEIGAALDTVFGDSADKALKSALAPAWLATMKSGRDHAFDLIGKKSVKDSKVDASFEVFNKLANEWIEKFGLIKAKEINTTTYNELKDRLRKQFEEGMGNGETIAQLKKRIIATCEGVYDNMTKARANLIARNESMQAVNSGSFMQASIEGVQKKQFLATRDDRTREAHAEADGQIVGINEPFLVGNEELMYPGDPAGSAENTIQCRCTMLFMFNE